MSAFCIVLATVAIRLVNLDYGKASNDNYVVSIYNKHTGKGKAFQICAGTLITSTCVLTTRFCLPHHAYKIRYGILQASNNASYSRIVDRKYHANSHPQLISNNRMNKNVVSGSNNIALALVQEVPDQQFGRLTAVDYKTVVGHEVKFCAFDLPPPESIHLNKVKRKRKKPMNLMSNQPLNLRTIFDRKKKLMKKEVAHNFKNMNIIRTNQVSNENIQNELRRRHESSFNKFNVLVSTPAIIVPCEGEMSMGPYICAVVKCFNFNIDTQRPATLTPDFGTPLIYDNKIIGITADIEVDRLKFTPISPYLNWIKSFLNDATRRYSLSKPNQTEQLQIIQSRRNETYT